MFQVQSLNDQPSSIREKLVAKISHLFFVKIRVIRGQKFPSLIRAIPCNPWQKTLAFIRVNPCNPWQKSLQEPFLRLATFLRTRLKVSGVMLR